MRKLFASLVAGCLAVLAAEDVWAQMGRGMGAGGGQGQGMGQGMGRGMGRGMGQGAGQGMPAQRGQGQGQFQGDMFSLIHNPAVQRELALTPEQGQKLRALGQTEAAQRAAQMLAQRGSCEKTDERRAVMAQVRDEIKTILREPQWKRFNEIWVQVRGVRALQSQRIAEELELTREQRSQVVGLLGGGFLGRAAEIEAEALALLNEDQRERFLAMHGEPFAMLERLRAGGGAGNPPMDGRGRGRQ